MSKMKSDEESCNLSSTDDDDEDPFPGFASIGHDYGSISDNNNAPFVEALQCESCLLTYPLQNTKFDHEVYQLMKKKKCLDDILWRCQTCRRRLKSSKTVRNRPNIGQQPSNSQLLEMIEGLQRRISILESSSTNVVERTKVVNLKPRSRREEIITSKAANKITHQLIVSTGEGETFTQKSFADKVKINLQTVPIKNIKVAKDGYGIIEFPNQETRDDGLSKLKDHFSVQRNNKPQRNLMPKITISGIATSEHSGNDVIILFE